MNKQLMISITTSEPRNPFSEIKVDVFERETENVEVHRVMGFYPSISNPISHLPWMTGSINA